MGPQYAELYLPPDRVVRLFPERVASGVRYGDGRYALHTKGNEALLERGGKVVLQSCLSSAVVPEADSLSSADREAEVVDSIERITAAGTPQVRRLQPEMRGWEPRVLSLWADSGRPVKLTVTEPDGSGRMNRQTAYYFVGGRLEVVRGDVSQYFFRDTTLILWTTDSTHQAAEVPLRDMVARQNFLLGEVRQYLAMFGVEP